MSDHEVEFNVHPAAGVNLAGRVQQLLIGDVFVDDPTHSFSGRLRGEGETTGAPILELFHQRHRDGVNAQGGQRYREMLVPELFPDPGDQLKNIGVIGG